MEAISNWPTPLNIKHIQSFLGLASFYRKFIHNFSTLTAPLTDCLRKNNFHWGQEQQDSFQNIKEHLCNSPVLNLPDFNLPFQVAVDASGVGIGAVLSQNNHPIEYFSEKLSHPKQNWNTMSRSSML